MATIKDGDFIIGTSYHPATGLRRRGHNEFYFTSRCGRWYTRRGNFGTMIVRDNADGTVHVVKGKMPEVVAFVNSR